MKYSIGDMVKVRDDLAVGHNYGGFLYDPLMDAFGGKMATVVRISGFPIKWGHYTLEFADHRRISFWTDEMLLPLMVTNDIKPDQEAFEALISPFHAPN